MVHIKKPSPLVGEGVSGADGRGKCEQKGEQMIGHVFLDCFLFVFRRNLRL